METFLRLPCYLQSSSRVPGGEPLQRGSSRQSVGAPAPEQNLRAPPPVPPPPMTPQNSLAAGSPTEDSSGRLSSTDATSSATQGGSPNAGRRDSQGNS